MSFLELSQALLKAVENEEERKVGEILSSIDASTAIPNIVNATDEYGRSALYWACMKGNLTNVNRLLQSSADLDQQTNDKHLYAGSTPLNRSCYEGHLDIVKVLIKGGADVSIKEEDGKDALTNAKRMNHTEIVNFLIKR